MKQTLMDAWPYILAAGSAVVAEWKLRGAPGKVPPSKWLGWILDFFKKDVPNGKLK